MSRLIILIDKAKDISAMQQGLIQKVSERSFFFQIVNKTMIQPDGQYDMKMDIMTYNAYEKVKKQYIKQIVLTSIKAVLLIIFTIIDYTVVTNQTNVITVFLGVAIGITCVSLLLNLLFFCIQIRNQQTILMLAIESNHAVNQPGTVGLVSQRIYNAQNNTQINSEGLTQDIKNRYEDIMQNLLKQAIVSRNPRYNNIDTLVSFLLFSLLIFGIVALAVGNPNTPELVVIIIFLVLQAFSHILVIVILILLALSPVLCFFACFILCCCSSQEQATLPEAVPATMPMINEAGKDCSICYQSFKVSDPVIQLRCSPKHMFHPICINGWIRMSQSCPICRKDLNGVER